MIPLNTTIPWRCTLYRETVRCTVTLWRSFSNWGLFDFWIFSEIRNSVWKLFSYWLSIQLSLSVDRVEHRHDIFAAYPQLVCPLLLFDVSWKVVEFIRRGDLNSFSLLAHDLVEQGRGNERLSWEFTMPFLKTDFCFLMQMISALFIPFVNVIK